MARAHGDARSRSLTRKGHSHGERATVGATVLGSLDNDPRGGCLGCGEGLLDSDGNASGDVFEDGCLRSGRVDRDYGRPRVGRFPDLGYQWNFAKEIDAEPFGLPSGAAVSEDSVLSPQWGHRK